MEKGDVVTITTVVLESDFGLVLKRNAIPPNPGDRAMIVSKLKRTVCLQHPVNSGQDWQWQLWVPDIIRKRVYETTREGS